ncbi:SAP30-binding protein [Planococcus citri]|uniref:SAP30-binding protein n=1 Tax=Planococcus citri TaxID=170843 RepID=UPI0031F72D54
MSSSKALASITATYTDSENEDGDNKEETSMDIESGEDEPEEEEPRIEVEYNDDGLPPEPTIPCPKELQDKITKLFERSQNDGVDMNDAIQNRKLFRNPSIYEKLIDFCGLNEFGTNYPAEIYDPLRWGRESFYDELAKVQKVEMEKREKEKKEKTKVEIVSGTAKKATSANGSASSSILSSVEGEKRRKTKWDQVDTSSNIRSQLLH